MAKSLRSKWRRKMRAIKRIRYGVKELDRLKNMLVKAGEIEIKEDGVIEHVCLVKAQKDEEEKMQIDRENKAENKDESNKKPKVQHPTWLRKKEYKKYLKSYKKQKMLNAKRLKTANKK
ncbi:protein LLP homolog [Daktulosphaira vitifoliae]|uniref:protein LLP homolog n=1 Tax=Daktulosphaira vitifoliae TaxID=58002 RepID=UPI0021A9A0BF|nr:protein LLP homolog [Daktulosphaira vitifoliae]